MATGAGAPGTKKKRTKGGRYSHEITKEEIEQYYHLPCEEASRQLGIGLTILKRICRRLGIEKWPYRFLKRQNKLDGHVAAGGGGSAPAGGSAAAPLLDATPSAADALAPAPKPQFQWGKPEAAGASGGTLSHSSGSSGGDSWAAAQRGAAPAPAPASLARQASEPLAPGVPTKEQPKQAAPPRRRAGAPPVGSTAAAAQRRRSMDKPAGPASAGARRSLELQRAAAAAPPASPEASGASGGASGGGGGSIGLQRAPSGAIKRRQREESEDVLDGLLPLGGGGGGDALGGGADAPPNPFAAAAEAASGFASPDPGGPDALAAGLSKLRMRTLSLKRQCSRDDTALDALDQALLMERLAAQPAPTAAASLMRATSMPAAGGLRRSPPLPPAWQPRLARVPQGAPLPLPPPLGALQEAGWLAQDQLRLSPRGQLPGQRPPAEAAAPPGSELYTLADPLADADPLSAPSLSAMLFGGPPRPNASFSDLVSESCLLPELPRGGPSSGALHKAGSSGELLETGSLLPGGGGGGDVLQLAHGSSSGSARLHLAGGGSSGMLGSPLEADTGLAGGGAAEPWPQQAQQAQQLGGAAGVTRVGPSAPFRSEPAGLLPPSSSADDHLDSPFGSAFEQLGGDDWLADLLGPAPTDSADAQIAELLAPLSPKASPADERLAGLLPPGRGALPPGAAPAPSPPLPPPLQAQQQQQQQQQQQSGGSPASMPAGSGSIMSHDTPTSSGGLPAAPAPMPMVPMVPVAPPAAAPPLAPQPARPAAADILALATSMLSDPDPAKRAVASRLLQKIRARTAARQAQAQAAAAQAAAAAQQAQATQQAQQAALWASGPPPAPSPTELEFQAAVSKHLEVQQQYLQQRDEVRAMLLQRQGGDDERLRQLARLKALKLQLAAAQQRQNELRAVREARLAARAAQAAAAQQLPPGMAAAPPAGQPLMLGSQQMLPFDLAGSSLGPPPPLPSASAFSGSMPQPQGRGAASLAAAQQAQQAQQEDTHASVAALFEEWTHEEVLPLRPRPPAAAVHMAGQWPAGAAAAAAAPPPQHHLPPAWAPFQQQGLQMQPGLPLAQRAASAPAPLPWDIDWTQML